MATRDFVSLSTGVRLEYVEQGPPGATTSFIVHEGAGHAFHWEDPARTAADLAEFLARAVFVSV